GTGATGAGKPAASGCASKAGDAASSVSASAETSSVSGPRPVGGGSDVGGWYIDWSSMEVPDVQNTISPGRPSKRTQFEAFLELLKVGRPSAWHQRCSSLPRLRAGAHMLRKTFTAIGIGLFSLVTALPIAAQETATLALKNGERPSGELVDMGTSGFVLRINGQDRQFPTNQVAAVEFFVGPLPQDAQQRGKQGQPLVLLRNGQVIEGRLSDVGGTHPLRLTVDTASGPRDFTSNEVAQLHLAPLNNRAPAPTQGGGGGTQAPPPASNPAPIRGAINVAAN